MDIQKNRLEQTVIYIYYIYIYIHAEREREREVRGREIERKNTLT